MKHSSIVRGVRPPSCSRNSTPAAPSRLHLRGSSIDGDSRRFLCTKLRTRFQAVKTLVGLWGATECVAEATKTPQTGLTFAIGTDGARWEAAT